MRESCLSDGGAFATLIAIISMLFVGGSSMAEDGRANGWESVLSAAVLTAVIVLGIFMTFFSSRLLSRTMLKGVPSSFTLELPPYRKPQIGKVIVRSVFDRTMFVLGRAAAVAAPAGLIIWIMANVSAGDKTLLLHCSSFLDPFARLLGMDGVILLAFVLGFPANEIVLPVMIMAYVANGTLTELDSLSSMKQIFTDNGWTWVTAVSVMMFLLLHFPCSTTCITIWKETQSRKWTAVSVLLPTCIGIAVCFAFNCTVTLIYKLFL